MGEPHARRGALRAARPWLSAHAKAHPLERAQNAPTVTRDSAPGSSWAARARGVKVWALSGRVWRHGGRRRGAGIAGGRSTGRDASAPSRAGSTRGMEGWAHAGHVSGECHWGVEERRREERVQGIEGSCRLRSCARDARKFTGCSPQSMQGCTRTQVPRTGATRCVPGEPRAERARARGLSRPSGSLCERELRRAWRTGAWSRPTGWVGRPHEARPLRPRWSPGGKASPSYATTTRMCTGVVPCGPPISLRILDQGSTLERMGLRIK